MAPKRKTDEEKAAAAAEKTAAKKAKADIAAARPAPEFNPKWKINRPSMLIFGDDEAGCDKVAAFDLDGTLVEWKEGYVFSLEPGTWVWYNDTVPGKLKEIHESGYKIVIFSNQATIKKALDGKAAAQFKAKIDEILTDAGVPATVFAATLKDDVNRKPGTGMWDHFTAECNDGKEVDKENSYFVGDAGGRPDDFAATDKEFAEAIGLPFKVPEDVFGESVLPNKAMANALKRLEKEIRDTGTRKEDGFKANALRKAASKIESHREKLTTGKEAGALDGVGKSTVARIDEYLATGVMTSNADKQKEKEPATEKENGGKKKKAGKESAGIAFL